MTIRDIDLGRQLYFYLKAYDPSHKRTLTSVAREFGVTRQAIRKLAKQYNIPLLFAEEKGNSPEREMNYVRKDPKPIAPSVTRNSTPDRKSAGATPYVEQPKKRKGKAPTPIPDDKQAYLRENYAVKPVTHLIKESGLSEFIVKRFLAEKDLKRPTQKQLSVERRKQHKQDRLAKKSKPQKRRGRAPTELPDDVVAYLRQNKNQPWSHLAKTVGYSYSIVKGFMHREGYVQEKVEGQPMFHSNSRKSIPEEVQTFLKENYSIPWAVLSKECGFSIDVVRRFMRENNLKRPKNDKVKRQRPEGELLKRGKKPYEFSDKDKEFITSDFTKPISEIARALGVSPAIVKRYLIEEGLYTVKSRGNRERSA